MGSIPASPDALNVPLLLCQERFNEASLPEQNDIKKTILRFTMHKQTNAAHDVIKSHCWKSFFRLLKAKHKFTINKKIRENLSQIRCFGKFTQTSRHGFLKQLTNHFFDG